MIGPVLSVLFCLNLKVKILTSFITHSTAWPPLNCDIVLLKFLALLRCPHLLLPSFPASLSVVNTELQKCDAPLLQNDLLTCSRWQSFTPQQTANSSLQHTHVTFLLPLLYLPLLRALKTSHLTAHPQLLISSLMYVIILGQTGVFVLSIVKGTVAVTLAYFPVDYYSKFTFGSTNSGFSFYLYAVPASKSGASRTWAGTWNLNV